jgi:hypothetical protein
VWCAPSLLWATWGRGRHLTSLVGAAGDSWARRTLTASYCVEEEARAHARTHTQTHIRTHRLEGRAHWFSEFRNFVVTHFNAVVSTFRNCFPRTDMTLHGSQVGFPLPLLILRRLVSDHWGFLFHSAIWIGSVVYEIRCCIINLTCEDYVLWRQKALLQNYVIENY